MTKLNKCACYFVLATALAFAFCCISNKVNVYAFVFHHQYHDTRRPNSRLLQSQQRIFKIPLKSNVAGSSVPTTDTTVSLDNLTIEGLLDEDTFQSNCLLHNTICRLRKQIPTILAVPLTSSTASEIYDENMKVVGPKGEELSSGIDELVSLSGLLVAGTAAAQRAFGVLSPFQQQLQQQQSSDNINSTRLNDQQGTTRVDCDIIIARNDNSDLIGGKRSITSSRSIVVLYASWMARPPQLLGRKIEGKSKLDINIKNGKVVMHELIDIKLGGTTISEPLGETLANLRRVVRSTNLFQDIPLFGILEEVRDELIEASMTSPTSKNNFDGDESEEGVEWDGEAPLFVVSIPTNVTNNSTRTYFPSKEDIKPISDERSTLMITYDKNASSSTASPQQSEYPSPGSNLWKVYESSHKSLARFLNVGIPTLATINERDGDDDYQQAITKEHLFVKNAKLIGIGGNTTILESGREIANVFETLSTIRTASSGRWQIKSTSANWVDRTLTINWTATSSSSSSQDLDEISSASKTASSVLGAGVSEISKTITSIKGTDRFTLNTDGDVLLMEQLNLVIGGSKIIDPEPIKSIIVAIERNGPNALPIGSDLISEIIRRLSTSSSREIDTLVKSRKKTGEYGQATDDPPPKLQGDAAVTLYNLMYTLHRELASLDTLSVPPASSFLDEDITLRGYMKETIVKGNSLYRRAVGVALSSYKNALRSNTIAVSSSQPTKATIEFTPKGNLRVSLIIDMKLNPPSPPLFVGVTSPTSSNERKAGQIPFKLELVSEYRLNKDGMIKEHRLLESRINGRLTPGDVVTRWLNGIISPTVSKTSSNGSSDTIDGMTTFFDMINWIRSNVGG